MSTSTTSNLAGKELIIAITGGIAAYKVADVVSKLVQAVTWINPRRSDVIPSAIPGSP